MYSIEWAKIFGRGSKLKSQSSPLQPGKTRLISGTVWALGFPDGTRIAYKARTTKAGSLAWKLRVLNLATGEETRPNGWMGSIFSMDCLEICRATVPRIFGWRELMALEHRAFSYETRGLRPSSGQSASL